MNYWNLVKWAFRDKEEKPVKGEEEIRLLNVEYTTPVTRTFLKLKDSKGDIFSSDPHRWMVIDDQFYGVDSALFQFCQKYIFREMPYPTMGLPVGKKESYHRTSEDIVQNYLGRVCFVFEKTSTIPKYRQDRAVYGVFAKAGSHRTGLSGLIHLADVKLVKEITWDNGEGTETYRLKKLNVSYKKPGTLEAVYGYRDLEITRYWQF